MTDKTKEELIGQIRLLQKRITELETIDLERKQQQQQQQDSRRLVTVVRDSNDAIMIQDSEGNITAWNHGAELMFGYSEQEALRMTIWQLTPPDKAAEQKDFSRRLFAGEEVASFETQRLTKDGRLLDVWLTVTKLVDNAGKVIGIATTERDITKYKQAEEMLRESEELVRIIQDTVMAGIILVDCQTREIVDANETAIKLFGKPRDQIIGVVCHNNICPAEVHNCPVLDLGQKVDCSERALLTADGSKRPILKKVVPVEVRGHRYLVESFIDIAERKKADEEIRASEKRYRALFEGSKDAIFIADPETRMLVDCNLAALKMTGYSKEEVLSIRADQLHPKDTVGEVMEIFVKQAAGEDIMAESAVLTKAGERIPVLINTAIVELGGKACLVGIFRDIKERKKIEEDLRNSEALFKSIATAVPIVLGITSNRAIRWLNGYFSELLGYSSEEMMGKNVRVVYESDEEYERVGKEFYSQIQDKGAAVVETHWRSKDGKIVSILLTGSSIYSGNLAGGVVFSGTDITERKNAEKAIRESEDKLRSIVDNIGIGVSLISPDMEILSLNNQMKKWNPHINLKDRHICYRSFNNPPREEICSYCPTVKTLRDGLVHEDVTETPMGDQICNYRILSSPVKDESGKVVAAIEMVEDITERKKISEAARKEKEFSDALINTAQAIMLVLDKKGCIVTFNPYMEQILGYRLEEVKGKDWFETFVPKEDKASIRELFSKAINGIQTEGDINSVITKDGRKIEIEWYDKTIRDAEGNVVALLSIGQDITERKKLEEEARKRLEELEVFYKASIGREERVLELKKEIEQLKKELGK